MSYSDVEKQGPMADANHAAPPETAAQQAPARQDGGQQPASPSTGQPDDEPAPFDPPFAPLGQPWLFWQDAVLLGLLGGALGALGWAYLKAISEVSDHWIKADGNSRWPKAASSLRFGAGRAWWIGLCAGVGLVVGLARALLQLESAPTFIQELRSMHCDMAVSFKSAVLTMLSLMGGVPMGPEAGLGAAAGLAGTLATRLRPAFKQQADTRRRVYLLSAMCSGFATVLPNPLVAVLLVLELGRPLDTLAVPAPQLVVMLAIGATASFLVYFAIAGDTYFNPVAFLETAASGVGLDSFYVLQGILFGIMGAAMGLVYIFFAGALKAVGRLVRSKLDTAIGRWPRVVAMSTAGGAAVGALGWAMPLVLTDGQATLPTIMTSPQAIGSSALAASAFAKMLAYHLAAECGFSGGLFLPMLSMSSALGAVFVNQTGVNKVVALSCSTIALGASLIPGPFMLSLMANSLLLVGPQGLVPIFVTAISAHLFCMGVGLPQGLASRISAKKAAKAAAAAAAATASQRDETI